MPSQQGKVSIVIPCYNKVKYISTMLDTVLAQTWDTVELILVNDGSTDGTREVIAAYEAQFEARGYEAIIIDQENAGVCAAAKTGLTHATGDYICMVDSDDELDPEYVSTLAGWLDSHADCDIAICSGINFRETENGREFWHYPSKRLPVDDNEIGPEHFLMGEIIRQTVWVYMVRAEYLRKCQVVESYFIDTRGSHEPGFVIPLLAYKGEKKYLPLALYNFNGSGDGHSQFGDMDHAQQFYDTYVELCDIAIDTLPEDIASPQRKCFLKKAALLSASLRLYRLAVNMKAEDAVIKSYAVSLLNNVNAAFALDPPWTREQIAGKEYRLTTAIGDCMFNHMSATDAEDFPGLDTSRLAIFTLPLGEGLIKRAL
jgi:glycosyltransferase involved in cell wall biosynthesis